MESLVIVCKLQRKESMVYEEGCRERAPTKVTLGQAHEDRRQSQDDMDITEVSFK